MHSTDNTERDPALPGVAARADTLAAQGDDLTLVQRPAPVKDATQQRLAFAEQPTIALPDAVLPANEPPTIQLPDGGSGAIQALVHEPTELTPDANSRVPAADPPTVAESSSATVRRAGPPRVPGYDLIERLGSGTYGEVWLAQDARTGIRVAIKFLHHGTGIDWQLIQAEVKQLALLHADPGIVQLLGVELDRVPPYYIMAYAEQGSLSRRLEQGPLPLAEALAIFRQLAEALAYVHAKGVRHCDLKPGNVLLKARKRVLIADFGQAHLSSDATPTLGTFFYMAPEQADLVRQIPDTRWDVYGLGAIFYAMLTGQPPREDLEVRAELGQIEDLGQRLQAYRAWVHKAPRPDKHRGVAGMDRRLAEIVDRCLEADPVRRLRDAGAVLAALARRERLQSQRPLLVFGFVAQVLLCLVLGGLGFLGVQVGIQQTEAGLLARLEASDPAATAVVSEEIAALRVRIIWLGVGITGAVMLLLSALWGWLIWTLRRKERTAQGSEW